MSSEASIVAVGIDHHFCSPDEIAGAAYDAQTLKYAREIALKSGAKEAFIISTCNRVEVYAAGDPQKILEACYEALSMNGNRCVAALSEKTREYWGADALAHLFEVASGIDSQMVGENEILGQIKAAYADALETGHLGPVFNRGLQKAIQCAKWIRTNTRIGSGSTTIGAVVAELAARIFDDFSEKNILLAGSGEVGKSVALALAARGAKRITVSSRTWENAHSLSNEVEGTAIAFERIIGELHHFDIAVFALSKAPDTVDFQTAVRASDLRKNSVMFFVDLGVPQNVSPQVGDLENVFLYDLADLSKQANENIELRKGEIARAKEEIARRVSYLWERVKKD